MSALTKLTIAQARSAMDAGDLTASRLTKAFLAVIDASQSSGASQTPQTRLKAFKAALVESGVDIKNLSPAVLEVMEFAAEIGFDQSIFSQNPIKVVGGSDAAVNSRSINGSAINSTQELSTMCYLGTDVKTGEAVILTVFISNAYSVDFDAIEKHTGIYIERDDNNNPTEEAKTGAGEYLNSAHGFFNPQVVGQYFESAEANDALPALYVFMHDMLLKTPTHTGTIVTNAANNQFNWEIVPSQLRNVFANLLGDNFSVVPKIGNKRENCWQVDVSPIYLFGGNPPKVLQEMQAKVEQEQAAMLKLFTGGSYKGDHWHSNLNTTSSNQAVLSMDLQRRGNILWEEEVKPHILEQIEQGVTTIAFADGASNYFVPYIRTLIDELDLQSYVHVISYADELVRHVQEQDIEKIHLLATADGLEMGEHSIFAPLADITDVVTPQDTMKTIPLMVDNPNKPAKKMPCPTGATQQFPDKKNTRAIKVAKIENLLREVKDADGNVVSEHADLLRDAISWIPEGETVVLGATELELLYLDDGLRQVFEERHLNVISPVMGLVAPAVVTNATSIKQPEEGSKYRGDGIENAPISQACDHADLVVLGQRLAFERALARGQLLTLTTPRV